MQQLIRIKEVLQATGLSQSGVYRMIQDDEFPRPRKISARAVGWDVEEVQQWISERPKTKPRNKTN